MSSSIEPLIKATLYTEYSRSEYLALLITQVFIVAIMATLLILWHVRHAHVKSDAIEIERAYIRQRSLDEDAQKRHLERQQAGSVNSVTMQR